MALTFPQLAMSRDGQRAIAVLELGSDLRSATGFDGFDVGTIVQLRPRGERCGLDTRVSGSFRAMWEVKGQTLKWDADFKAALPELGLIAVARFLDANEIPADPSDDRYALRVSITADLLDIFRQQSASDAELATYVRGKLAWAWRFKAEPTVFESWEARRLGVEVSDLEQAAFPNIGALWSRDAAGYRALPALLRSSTAFAPATSDVSPNRAYDVALSFAGEQRLYVQRVAKLLVDAGVRVFYDEYADLWGKDLTKELEHVYRHASRFVIVFVSREYVAKAWPNLERQHALAGRIERMDDSVLPARFDASELPGLPATVAYREIGRESADDLARAILMKLQLSPNVDPSATVKESGSNDLSLRQGGLTVPEGTVLRSELRELMEEAKRLEASVNEWLQAELDHGWKTGMRHVARQNRDDAAAALIGVERRQLAITTSLSQKSDPPVPAECPQCQASTAVVGARLVSGSFRQVVQCSGPMPHQMLGDVILGVDG